MQIYKSIIFKLVQDLESVNLPFQNYCYWIRQSFKVIVILLLLFIVLPGNINNSFLSFTCLCYSDKLLIKTNYNQDVCCYWYFWHYVNSTDYYYIVTCKLLLSFLLVKHISLGWVTVSFWYHYLCWYHYNNYLHRKYHIILT